MSFFNQIYERLFSKNKSDILSKEVLKRSEKEKAAFEVWSSSDDAKHLLNRIKRAYHFKKTNIEDDIIIDILDTPYAKGIGISNLPQADKKVYQQLIDHFRHRVLSLSYRQSGSDKRVKNQQNRMVITEKYYLKPPIQTEPPIDQLYGNILIELLCYDDIPGIIKIQANVYSDSLYKDPLDFDELVSQLFQLDQNDE